MKGRKEELLATDSIHLLPDDPHDLRPYPLAEGKHRVVAGRELADVTGPDQQAVGDGLGVGRILTKGRYEGL
jgi:hypothetical protein